MFKTHSSDTVFSLYIFLNNRHRLLPDFDGFSFNGELLLKAVKVIGALLIIVQIMSVLAFGLSFHTVTSILMTTLSGEPVQLEMRFDPSGKGEMVVELLPSNQGFLDVDMTLKVGAIDRFGEYIAVNSTLAHLSAGDNRVLSLILQISSEDYVRLVEESSVEVTVDLRTLYNLVGISNSLCMEVQSQ